MPQYNIDYGIHSTLKFIKGKFEDPLDVMKKGYRVSMFLGIVGFPLICYKFLNINGSWVEFSLCGWIGIVISYLFIEITRYYTDFNFAPVRKIVNVHKLKKASRHGPATNIIAGISVGLESTVMPILVIVAGLLLSFKLGEFSGIKNMKGQPIGGLFGTAVATMGMFSTGVFILAMSGFGPIADNAGGIAEMSHQNENVRSITDLLDAVGNVTKANTKGLTFIKGYSVGSASLACFLLFAAFIDEVNFIS